MFGGGAPSAPAPREPDPAIAEAERLKREEEAEEARQKQLQKDGRTSNRKNLNSLITGSLGVDDDETKDQRSLF